MRWTQMGRRQQCELRKPQEEGGLNLCVSKP